MKIDMHCHVKEGSIDCMVSLDEYITILKEKGFHGMVITDHNTYRGYRYWKNNLKGKKHTDFVVLKGIEYDTTDGGHILVIMPEGVKLKLLELRGLTVAKLIEVVHRHGGVLGPAHPCGEKYQGITKTTAYNRSPEIMSRFDFLEGFNCCESPSSNAAAMTLADKYGLLTCGGSDAHRPECVGLAYTIIPEFITCETEFIRMIHRNTPLQCGGSYYNKTTKERMGRINMILVYSFWLYNKTMNMMRGRGRRARIGIDNPFDPIDPVEIHFTMR